jgi:2-oxoglutarate dehydrogenase E2 component (dihydrolipoamide succinyltransferase)
MAQLIDIALPTDQTEGTNNVVGRWFKAVGDQVRTNDPLLEIITDKVTVEIAAPSDGMLVEILKQEGDQVEPGNIVGRIGPVGTTASASPAPPRTEPAVASPAATTAEAELSPAVRRLLKEHGLDPRTMKGSGRGGRISVEDVEAAIAAGKGGTTSRMVPHNAMRKSIAAHMSASMATAPHVTSVFEADLTRVMADRDRQRALFEAKGVKLTYTAYFVRATVQALSAVPEVNSRWHENALELFADTNIGIGTALETGGLIVPVVHQAQTLDLFQTAERLQDLTTRARAGSLTPKEVQGGTFTISNHGVSGSLVATPIIINQPQSAILGIGKLEQRAVVVGSVVEVRPRLYVTLTIDHRVLDGFQANAFLTAWVKAIETSSS